MCGLFGFYNYSGKEIKGVHRLLEELGTASSVRGTDATGVSYVLDGKLEIEKSPKPSYTFNFSCPDDVVAVMGHVRNTTQGNPKKNYNNHPFKGKVRNSAFSLAHNGIIYNDKTLQKQMKLPKTKIETDSYVAVQLLEKSKELTLTSVREMAEELDGMFTITILDDTNHLWIVKNDNPLVILNFPDLGMYIYASTENILLEACMEWFETSRLIMDSFRNKVYNLDVIEPEAGDILVINPDGSITDSVFTPPIPFSYYNNYRMRDNSKTAEAEDILIKKVITQGFNRKDIEDLLWDGYTLEEIEEGLEYGYLGEMIEDSKNWYEYYHTTGQNDNDLKDAK